MHFVIENEIMKKILFILLFLLFFVTGLIFVIKHYEYPLGDLGFQVPYLKDVKPDKNYDAKYSGPRTVLKTVDILHYSEPRANQIMLDFIKKMMKVSL